MCFQLGGGGGDSPPPPPPCSTGNRYAVGDRVKSQFYKEAYFETINPENKPLFYGLIRKITYYFTDFIRKIRYYFTD